MYELSTVYCLLSTVYCLLSTVYNLLFSLFLFQGAHIVSLDTWTEEIKKAKEIEIKRIQHGIVRGHLHTPYMAYKTKKKLLTLADSLLFKGDHVDQ